MSGGRKFITGLLVSLLFFAITAGSLLASISTVLTNRDYFKEVLGQETVYNSLAQAVLEQPFQNVGNPTEAQGETPEVNTESLQKLINQYFTRDWYKGAVNTAVDGVYRWLEGKTALPDFAIPITTDKAGFQQFIIDTVAAQYNALPVCEGDPAAVTEINPLDADCRLPTFSGAQVDAYIRSHGGDEQFNELFNQASFNSTKIFGQVSPETTQSLQSSYRLLRVIPWVFMVGTLVLVGLLFLAIHNRQQAFKIVGLAILAPTVLVLIGGLLGWIAHRHIVDTATPSSSAGSDVMSEVAQQVVGGMLSKLNGQLLLYGSGLLILGLTSLVLHRRFNRAAVPMLSSQVKK